MRTLTILAALLAAPTAHAAPATQACLGDLDTVLTCPTGAQRTGHSCRSKTGAHWSGSMRQGPTVFMRSDTSVSFAASYKDHKKHGRTYRFDKAGKLESWSDHANDELHGAYVWCLPDGRVRHIAYYKQGRVTGISRSWRTSDGVFSFAMDRDAQGRSFNVDVPAALQQRPDHLCQPQRCDLAAAPDLSGLKP